MPNDENSPPEAGGLRRADDELLRFMEQDSVDKYTPGQPLNCSVGEVCSELVPLVLFQETTRRAFLKAASDEIVKKLGGHRRASEIVDLRAKLNNCGRFLELKRWLQSGNVELVKAAYCGDFINCPCCAHARSLRLLAEYLPVVDYLRSIGYHIYMISLTWPTQPMVVDGGVIRDQDSIEWLRRDMRVGESALNAMWGRGNRRTLTTLQECQGMIWSWDITRNQHNGNWHPHLHLLAAYLSGTRPDVVELRHEWWARTDGVQIWVDYIPPPVEGFKRDEVEVLKYIATFDEKKLSVWDRVLIRRATRGMRLIKTKGVFFDCNCPREIKVKEYGEWELWLARWIGAALGGYEHSIIGRGIEELSAAE